MSTAPTRAAQATAVTQQVCSWLLAYPDADVRRRLPLLTGAVQSLPDETRIPLQRFLDYLATARPEAAMEHYVATFDMRRRCSPFLTYWTHGDTRNRGMALLRFKQTYRDCGMAPSADELPDHLSVVLEFAAIGDREAGNVLLGEHRVAIELFRDALHDIGSPYAHVADAIVTTLIPMTPALAARAKALAASGPPTELVGAGGPVDIQIAPYSVSSDPHLTRARR
jgi:nitrate reductase delta subunit